MEQSVALLPQSNGPSALSKATVNVNVGGRKARLPSELVSRRLESSRLAVFCQKSHVERLTDCDAFFESTSEKIASTYGNLPDSIALRIGLLANPHSFPVFLLSTRREQ
ncbi:hypothetical protein WR25_09122 [Diploscapter pachys]|uniref:Uncharacterized protein n=1 Tax=Diploscapter pachys TaxID=2018661 RepID=A0A2A2LII7_9BILA|nr:hypothetical protein WR25_09122 [Diploscapter pachys]